MYLEFSSYVFFFFFPDGKREIKQNISLSLGFGLPSHGIKWRLTLEITSSNQDLPDLAAY